MVCILGALQIHYHLTRREADQPRVPSAHIFSAFLLHQGLQQERKLGTSLLSKNPQGRLAMMT